MTPSVRASFQGRCIVLVRWDEIPETGLWLNITDDAWLAGGEIRHEGPVVCTLFLERVGQRVLLEGSFGVTVLLECDRCLAIFRHRLDSRFKIDFELSVGPEEGAGAAADHICGSDEMDTVFLDEPVIDIISVLSQQLFLALPEKKLCHEGCPGLCPGCGADLNSESCFCQIRSAAAPFAVLARLKKDQT